MSPTRPSITSWPAWEPLPPRAVTVNCGVFDDHPVALWPLGVAALLETASPNPRLQTPDTGELLLPLALQGDGEHWRLMSAAQAQGIELFFNGAEIRALEARRPGQDHEARWPERCLPMTAEGALLLFADRILEPRLKIERRQLTGLLSVIDGVLSIDDHDWLTQQRRGVATHIEVVAGSPEALAVEPADTEDPLFPRMEDYRLRPVITRSMLEVADTAVAMIIRGLKHAPTPIPDVIAAAKAIRWPRRPDVARVAERLVRQCALSPDFIPPPERHLDALPEGIPLPGDRSGLMPPPLPQP